jgi:hypothetical protein
MGGVQSRTAGGRAPACTSDAGARKVGRQPAGSAAPILDGMGGFPPLHSLEPGSAVRHSLQRCRASGQARPHFGEVTVLTTALRIAVSGVLLLHSAGSE